MGCAEIAHDQNGYIFVAKSFITYIDFISGSGEAIIGGPWGGSGHKDLFVAKLNDEFGGFDEVDCLGNWPILAQEDECGVCDVDESNDCFQDCEGTWGGNVEIINYWCDDE